MSTEHITLYGGPCDGERLQFDGGDCIAMMPRNRPFHPSNTDDFTDQAPVQQLLYRRSLKSRDIFVYQP